MTITLTGADYRLAAGQTLDLVNDLTAVSDSGNSPFSVDIAGSILDRATSAVSMGGLSPSFFGLNLTAQPAGSGAVTIEASGHISLDTTAAASPVTGVLDSGLPLVNAGTVEAHTASGMAIGIEVAATTVSNQGTIEVSSASGPAIGLEVLSATTTVNDGLIEVTGTLLSNAVKMAVGATSFTNNGEVIMHGLDQVAVAMAGQNQFTPLTVVNTGLIQGDAAFQATSQAFSPSPVTFQNSGSIVGVVGFADGADTLTNSGSMNGAISLFGGNDVYDGRLGTENGLLQGGAGDDTLTGGAGFDNLQGNQGNDSVSGGAGDDIVVGGKDDDIQAGGDGNDVVWGNLGNDTLDGGNGADQVRGGQGDDSVSGGAGNDFVSGDRGNDTETGGAGADNFHGSQDAGIDRVLDFNLAEGDRVELDPGTTYTVSQVGADTVIDMGAINGAPNQMVLVGVQMSTLIGNWIFEG